MNPHREVREFLSSRRARISPEQAGLPAYGGNRRVKGLRREEVAMLAGVSVDYDNITRDAAAMLRLEAGQNPHDDDLIALVGELSTRSELFRKQWASQDVRFHRSGRKRLRHPAIGQLDLDFEAMHLPSDPGLQLNIYTAPANTPASDGLKLLASWAASHNDLASERAALKH
jgi:MmyB-like transcription regulator ligand binding domain